MIISPFCVLCAITHNNAATLRKGPQLTANLAFANKHLLPTFIPSPRHCLVCTTSKINANKTHAHTYTQQPCDGGLRQWLLTAVCVTAVCGMLGAAFHGRGDGTRPSRFLDDDEDDDYAQPAPAMGMDLGPMEAAQNGGGGNESGDAGGSGTTLPTLAEEEGVSPFPGGSVSSDLPDSCGTSVTS